MSKHSKQSDSKQSGQWSLKQNLYADFVAWENISELIADSVELVNSGSV